MEKKAFLQNTKKILTFLLVFMMLLSVIPVSVQAAEKTKNIKKTKISLQYKSTVYSGKTKKPAVTVKYGKTTLKKNKHYTVSYKNNKKVGKATVIIKGKGKWKGTVKKTFKILPEFPDSDMVEANAKIAIQILKDRIETEGKKNALFSPFSLYEDLAMAANGAGGQTLKEFEEYLGEDIEEVNAMIKAYNHALPDTLQVANSIWLNESYGTLDTEFQKKTTRLYDAQIQSVPYNNETVERINGWVKEHTHNMIPKLIDQLSEEEVMHLLNAVVFEAQWKTPYDKSDIQKKTKFTREDGTTEKCTMLRSEEKKYVKISGENGEIIAYGFLKPYADNQTAFLGILPVEGKTPEDVLEVLDGESYVEMYQNRKTYTKGTLYAGIPEFSLDDSLNLTPYLKQEGLRQAFTNDADFAGMVQDFPYIHIDTVIQKTHIEVDRKGTRAAAATDIVMKANSAFDPDKKDLRLILDRPFLYAIVDYQSGMPFFMGIQQSVR